MSDILRSPFRLLLSLLLVLDASAREPIPAPTNTVRARDLRIRFDGTPGQCDAMNDPVFAGYFSLNGNGEMTGTAWVEESGFLEGPIVLTTPHSVGVARD